MASMFARDLQTPCLYSIKIVGLNTSQNIVKTPSITIHGHKLQRLNTWLLFQKKDAQIMQPLGVSLNRGVRDEVPLKKQVWGGCVCVCVWYLRWLLTKWTWTTHTHTHTHTLHRTRTRYLQSKISLAQLKSPGATMIMIIQISRE
jgi:hypothetical protein